MNYIGKVFYQEIFKSKPIESVHPSKKKWGLSFDANKFPTLFIKLHRKGLIISEQGGVEFFTVTCKLSELEEELKELRKIYEN